MPVIKCPTCNGTGKITIDKPALIAKTQQLYGCRIGDDSPFMFQEIINCPDCGGSGCKWKEESER